MKLPDNKNTDPVATNTIEPSGCDQAISSRIDATAYVWLRINQLQPVSFSSRYDHQRLKKKIQLKEFIHSRYACNCVCFVVVVVFIIIVVIKRQHEQAKVCFNLWKTSMETYKMLKTIPDETLSCTLIFEWFKRFR